MMKPIDDEGRGLKLESLKELLKSMKQGSLEKLPKGKGMSVTSISVSKPKDAEEEMDMEEEMSSDPLASQESMEDSEDVSEEAAEVMPEQEDSEEEDEFQLPEPKIPADVMELVMSMLKNKKAE